MRQGYEWKSSKRLKTKLIGKILGILRLLFMFIRFLCSLLPLIELPRTYISFQSQSTLCALQMCIRALHSITTQKHQRYVVLKSVTKLSPKPVLSKWAVHRFPFSLHRANYMQNVARCYRRKPRSPSERHTM